MPLAPHDFLFILSGALVGFVVGVTGVGGGSLMTPLLTLMGVPLHTAIGTDLLYASISKTGGAIVHHRHRNIDWRITLTLAAGSLPAALLTVWGLKYWFPDASAYKSILTHALGFMLLVTALSLLLRPWLQRRLQARTHTPVRDFLARHQTAATVAMGVALGVLVTLSSIGAGVFGVMVLVTLFPALAMIRIIGTDVTHAVLLTLVAGLGHLSMGNVDWHLLGLLLIGSLPMIVIGTNLSSRMREDLIRPILGVTLMLLSVKFIFF
jgi:uncharacterized membrane protein YfcA